MQKHVSSLNRSFGEGDTCRRADSCFGISERHSRHCVLRSVQVLGNSGVFQPLSPSSLSVDARSLRRVRSLLISLRAKRTLTKDEKYVFHELCSIFARAALFVENRVWSVLVVLVRCPPLLRFFLGCVGGQQLLQRLVKWLFAIALGTLLFGLSQGVMLYLIHSGSCGNLSHGVCPHATLMTTSTPKTQWTKAKTVVFGRGVTTLSTRHACVENENVWSRVSVLGSHEMCVLNWNHKYRR